MILFLGIDKLSNLGNEVDSPLHDSFFGGILVEMVDTFFQKIANTSVLINEDVKGKYSETYIVLTVLFFLKNFILSAALSAVPEVATNYNSVLSFANFYSKSNQSNCKTVPRMKN